VIIKLSTPDTVLKILVRYIFCKLTNTELKIPNEFEMKKINRLILNAVTLSNFRSWGTLKSEIKSSENTNPMLQNISEKKM